MRQLLLPFLATVAVVAAAAGAEEEDLRKAGGLAQSFWRQAERREMDEAAFDALWTRVPADAQLEFVFGVVREAVAFRELAAELEQAATNLTRLRDENLALRAEVIALKEALLATKRELAGGDQEEAGLP